MNDKKNTILTIREYENSVAMPEEERVTYLDPRGGPHLKTGDDKATAYEEYAMKCAEYLRFGDEIDLATCGGYNSHDALKICDTPQILLDAGFDQKPMLYTQRHLLQAIAPKIDDDPHRHGLPIEQVKRFPELFESPAMLANSPARGDVLLAVLCATDPDGLPLIAGIKPDGRGNYELNEIETNMVLSVYGKRNFARYFNMLREPGSLVYISKEKSQELERLSKLQLLGDYSSLDLDTIIRRPECLVNQSSTGSRGLETEAREARASSKTLSAENGKETSYEIGHR